MEHERRYALAMKQDGRDTILGFDFDLASANEIRQELHAGGFRSFVKRHDAGYPVLDNAIARSVIGAITCSVCGHAASDHPAKGWVEKGHCIRCYMREDYWDGEIELTLPSCTLSLHDVLIAHIANVGRSMFVVVANVPFGCRKCYVGPAFTESEFPIALERDCAETIAAHIPNAAIASYTVEPVPSAIRNAQ